MPLPVGFVEEQIATMPEGFTPESTEGNLPTGFVEEGKVTPEISQPPKLGIFDKMISFFRDPDKEIAKAQNIYALSDVTGLPLHEVNRNYDILRRSVKVTGITPDLDNKEFMQMVMLPGIVAGAVANPVGTAAGLIAFGALNKAIPTDKFINNLKEKGVNEDVLTTIELADFIGKGLIIGGVFSKAPKIVEGFLKQKIIDYKLPETLSLSAGQIKDIYGSKLLTTPEQQEIFTKLNLNSYDARAALEHGIDITIPAEKVITLMDRPYWVKLKEILRIKPTAKVEAPEVTSKIKSEAITPVEKVISALSKVKSVRGEQETLYAKARSQKFAKMQAVGEKVRGEKGFYAQLGALKGEMPKVEFESIRDKLKQGDIDALFNMVKDSPKIGEWEKLSAREGLAKLFNEYGGKVPTTNEINLLNQVFGEEFTKAILEKRTFFEKAKEVGIQLANVPRSIMASFDLSAPLRQGVFLIGKPKQFWPAFKRMFGALKNETAYMAIQDNIITHTDYQLSRDSKLSLTDMDVLLSSREEQFMSNYAEKIPVIGRGVRASGRAYVAFLNKLRFDTFVDLLNKAENVGLKPRENRDLSKNIADFINNATGRGTLPGAFQKSANGLNVIFFSPRLIISRLRLLNPIYYMKQDPFVRKEALKSLFSFVGIGTTILTLAKMAGVEVGLDWRSSDFAKIKIGNTRIDIWGGFQPLVRVAGQLITGKYISSTTGKEMTLGKGYRPLTRADIVQHFIEGKLAPIPSFILSLLKGQDITGEKISVTKEVIQRFIPMVIGDLYDLAKENPGLMPVGLAGFFGVGIQTYKKKRYW